MNAPSDDTRECSQSKGRKAKPCPDVGALLAAYEADPRPTLIARQIDADRKQVRRWLGELGIELPPLRPQRPRGVTPPYVRIATLTRTGKRKKCRLYKIWDGIFERCYHPRKQNYKYYGGRGITICDEWKDYDVFRAWAIANGYGKGQTIDRIDSDGHYEPSNCRWIPQSEQQFSTRRTHQLTLRGVTKSLPEWAHELGMPKEVLRVRRRNGWPDEHVLTIPVGGRCPGFPYKRPGRKTRTNQETP